VDLNAIGISCTLIIRDGLLQSHGAAEIYNQESPSLALGADSCTDINRYVNKALIWIIGSEQFDKSTPQAFGCEYSPRINRLLDSSQPLQILITIPQKYRAGLRRRCVVDVLISACNPQIISSGIESLNGVGRHPINVGVVGTFCPCRRDKNHFQMDQYKYRGNSTLGYRV
jgi:hypothetical protein